MKLAILVLVLGALLAAAIAFGLFAFVRLSDVEIGTHGTIALIAGSLFTLLLGGGLMFLVFYSSRHGHDEAGQSLRDDERSE